MCKKHPNYKAIHEPTAACQGCKDMYNLKLQKNKICDCPCDHTDARKPIYLVNVISNKNGYDWGHFYYCQEAIHEDVKHRNMKVIIHE